VGGESEVRESMNRSEGHVLGKGEGLIASTPKGRLDKEQGAFRTKTEAVFNLSGYAKHGRTKTRGELR